MSVFEMDAYEVFKGSPQGESFIVQEQCEEWFARHFAVDPDRVQCEVISRSGVVLDNKFIGESESFDVRVRVFDHVGQDGFNLDQNELMTLACVFWKKGTVTNIRLAIGKMSTRLTVREVNVFGGEEAQSNALKNVIALGEILATRDSRRKNVYYA